MNLLLVSPEYKDCQGFIITKGLLFSKKSNTDF